MSTSSGPEHQGTTAGRARKAAGTVSFADVLGGVLLRRPAERPDEDLDELRQGTTLFVSAFRRRGRRFKQGRLVLQADASAPAVWRPYRLLRGYGPGITLSRPFDVQSVGPVAGPGSWAVAAELFRLITVYAAGQLWELAVPAADVDVVRAAVSAANSRTG